MNCTSTSKVQLYVPARFELYQYKVFGMICAEQIRRIRTRILTTYCLPLQSVNCNGLVHRYRNHIPYRAVCSTGAAGTSIARTWRQRFSFASAAVVVRISTWCRCSGYVLKYRPPMKRGRCWRCSGSASSHCDNAVSPQRGNRRNDSGVVRTEEGLEGHQSRASVALVSAHGSKRNGVSGIPGT